MATQNLVPLNADYGCQMRWLSKKHIPCVTNRQTNDRSFLTLFSFVFRHLQLSETLTSQVCNSTSQHIEFGPTIGISRWI